MDDELKECVVCQKFADRLIAEMENENFGIEE